MPWTMDDDHDDSSQTDFGERRENIGKDAQFGMRNSHNGPLNIERRKELSLKYELSWMHLYPSLSVEERM